MAKLSRNDLKEVVKECLIEILAEGLVGSSARMNESAPRKRTRKKSKNPRPSAPDNLTYNEDNVVFNKAVEGSVKKLTDDDVLASIFADTAKTTLQEQLGAEGRGPAMADPASRKMDQLDPVDAFGEEGQDEDHWAKLAFADARPSKPDNK